MKLFLAILMLLPISALAQFRTTNSVFPLTTSLDSTDVFLIGRPGVTNFNMSATNVAQGIFDVAGGTLVVTNLEALNIYGNGPGLSNVAIMPTTLYVSASVGSDTTAQRGDPSRPWQTISNAVYAAQYGDTVCVLAGTNYGRVVMKEGVSLYYAPSAVHHVGANDWFYDCMGVTNVMITGYGSLFRTNSSIIPQIFFSSVSNVNLKIFAQFYQLGNAEQDTSSFILVSYSFSNLTVSAVASGLLTPQVLNTNRSAVINWLGPAGQIWADQHQDWTATNRIFMASLDGNAPEVSHNFGIVEMYSGNYFDNGNPLGMHDGNVFLFGTRVSGEAALLDAYRWNSYPTATNIHGYYFRNGRLVAENAFRINKQGGAAQLEFVSRSGDNTLATNLVWFDATNNIMKTSGVILDAPLSVTNLNFGATPTVTTNVTWWTTASLLTGQANGGGSGIAANGAAVSLRSGSLDHRGVIDLYYGTSTGTANTNLCTLIFSKTFAVPPTVLMTVTYSNTTSATVGVCVRDVTTTNVLFASGGTAPITGGRAIISYWVLP